MVFYEDSRNNIWLGTRTEGLFHIEGGDPGNEVKGYNKENGYFGNNKIFGILEDEKNNLIILNRDIGLVYIDSKTNNFYTYTQDIYEPTSINSKALRSSLKNSTGTIFIGTFNSGINFIDNKRKAFEHYKVNFKENGLFNNNVRSFFQDSKGTIWVGTKENGGLSRFDKHSGTFKNYEVRTNGQAGTIADFIFTINELDANNLLLGTLQNGLIKFNKNTETFQPFNIDITNADTPENNFTYIYDIKKGDNGIFWIGKFEALIRYDAIHNKTTHINQINQIRTILISNDSLIWVGTEAKGLYLYNDRSSEIINISEPNKILPQIDGKRIIALLKDGDILWVGTEGNGLNKLNLQGKTVKVYTEEDGLANNRVAGILKDEQDNLWISTGNGLSKFGIKKENFQNFNKQDGLQGNEFSNFVHLKLNNGEMMFGGNNGFNIFNPSEIKKNETPPKVYITGFKLFNKPVTIGRQGSPLTKHISETSEITLTYKQSVFSIEYIGLNYTSPEKNQYKYKLENFDNEWMDAGANRTATYTSLPAGDYIFKVKASNNDGVWNGTPAELRIKILAPWWNTWWFRIIMFFLVIGSIIVFYLLKMQQMLSIHNMLEEKVYARTRELETANIKLNEKQEEITLQNERIKEQNNDLIASEEELRSLNEELSSKHDMLLEQKEELETTLNKLKETQSQLLHSEKMASLGILTAGIAHELNNPLNFIQSGLYAIENYYSNKPETQKKEIKPLLKSVETGIQRATNIIKNMNKFSHVSKDYIQICDIHEIIESCLVIINNEVKNKIEVVKNYTEKKYTLEGNEGKLNQVFLNILINACQAIEESGRIIITTKIENKNIIVIIEDTGVGISKENINKVMVPFFTTKDPGKGTGLGMSISYTLIQEHNGSIDYESEPGEGTTVTVKLPVLGSGL